LVSYSMDVIWVIPEFVISFVLVIVTLSYKFD